MSKLLAFKSFHAFCAALLVTLPSVAAPGPNAGASAGADSRVISVATGRSKLTMFVAADGRLYQLGYGAAGDSAIPNRQPTRPNEFYPPAGDGFIFEPALQVTHADGNTSTDLAYVRHAVTAIDDNVTLLRIELKDRFYPFFVTLCLRAFRAEDVIEQWVEIRNEETGPATLYRFASSGLVMPKADDYWLTHFHGDWAKEAQLVEERLTSGIKVLDSKIGVRAHQYRTPSFMLAVGQPASEEKGEVFGGSLEWSGSFQFALEVDPWNRVRALGGINPFGSQYRLAAGMVFVTPAILWSRSGEGKGELSRNFHRWARRYGIRDGDKPRPVLLNNWEATRFNFDEARIVALFDGAKELGAETFLLDDGWFGNRHPRDNDKAGLGDWQVNTNKLPHGLSYLVEQAGKRGVNFGIWLEPEMVNPVSDLFEQHPDWAIGQPHRAVILHRNQRVLDLSRPAVREFAWKVIDDTMGSAPGISYVKWDCNCFVTQPGSSWLKPEEQSHLLIDYQRSLYDVMGRMATNHPGVMEMLCSGGGGRVDYGALKYFHSFWASDNTDPARRVFIQWGFGHFFPASSIAAHVTRMGKRPLKFAFDVAFSGALGMDLDVGKLTPEERKFAAAAAGLYKERLRGVVQQGDLYRLESPYDGPRAALDYVTANRSQAVLFVYQLKDGEAKAVKPRGLDPKRSYRLREANLPEGAASQLTANGQVFEGAGLMRDGFQPPCQKEYTSAVIELVAEAAK
jgi:alpha-galactosidase